MAAASNRQKDIFLKALDLSSAEERAAYLTRACAGDDALRRQIDAMLQAHGAADSFLEKPAAAMGATVDAERAPSMAAMLPAEQIGARIGPYKLLEKIGEGGMGVVFMAEQQEPVRRMVALKIVKPGMDSHQVLARFEAERQALALMDHPNIARVLDAGTTPEGRPYFVMELVKGVTITQYCDERRLTPRQRLELFIPVCQAVQHAHQKGIIHRDLKPSNILIAQYDGRPVPKVIDFGVAKATGQQLTDRTLFTGFGSVVGTLAYMSPEQAELNQIDIDTRSDIYSLGVVLYELLTGSTPLSRERLKGGALLEVLRMIREEEPPRPSNRISTAQTLATLSEQRQTEPAKLANLVRGDIDWIVMKALDKDRNRRYESAATLGQDIERYLRDEPVEASPPSASYRLRKFVKRNRGAVLAASLVLFALLGGIGGTTAGLFEARRQAATALDAQKKSHANEMLAIAAGERATEALGKAEQSAKDEKTARKLAVESEIEVKKRLVEAKQTLFTAQINRAAALWQYNPLEGLKVLRNHENCPHKDRDFAWHFYHRLCDVERTIYRGVGRRLTSVAFQQHFLAAGCVDHSVLVWAHGMGQLQRQLKGHEGPVNALAFADRGSGQYTLFSAGDDRRIQRWAVHEGWKAHPEPFVMPGAVSGLALHGKWLAASSHVENKNDKSSGRLTQGAVILWDYTSGKSKAIKTGMSDGVLNVSFSDDGKWIAAGFAKDACARVWSVDTGEEYGRFKADGQEGWVQGLQFTPDGKYLAVASADLKIYLFDFATKRVAQVHEGHQHELWGLAVSPNSKLLASTGWDRTVRLWDIDQRWDSPRGAPRPPRELMVFPGFEESPVAFSWDGLRLIVQKDGNLVHLAARLDAEERTFQHPDFDGVLALAYAPDARFLATASKDGAARIVDTRSGIWVPLTQFTTASRCVAFSGDSRILFVGGSVERPDKTLVHQVARWDVNSRKELEPWLGHASPVTALSVSGKHGLLASGSQDGALKIWDAATGKIVAEQVAQADRTIKTLAFHPTEKLLASLSHGKQGGFLTLWDVSDGRFREIKKDAAQATGLAFTSNGSKLIVGSDYGVSILDVVKRKWEGHLETNKYVTDSRFQVSESVNPVALTPDDRTLAVGMKDRTIQLWDLPSGKLRTILTGHVRSVTALAFRPDGQELASGDRFLDRKLEWVKGGALKLWSAEPRRPLGHDHPCDSLAFARNGGLLSTRSTDGQILWDPETGRERTVLGRLPDQYPAGTLTPDSRHVVDWDRHGNAKNALVVRDALTGEVVLRHEVSHAEAPEFVFGPGHTVSWLAGYEWNALDLDARKMLPSRKLPRAYASLPPIAAPSGRWLARLDDKAMHVWRWQDEREFTLNYDPALRPIRLVPIDDERLLAFHTDGKARVWHIETGRTLATFDEDAPNCYAVSPDGQTLAVAVPEGGSRMSPAAPQGGSPVIEQFKAPPPRWEVRLWKLSTGTVWQQAVPIGGAEQMALALTADQRLLVAVADGNAPRFLPAVKYR